MRKPIPDSHYLRFYSLLETHLGIITVSVRIQGGIQSHYLCYGWDLLYELDLPHLWTESI